MIFFDFFLFFKGDVDFVATTQDRTFTALNQNQPSCVQVTINNDELFEGREIFFGTLSTDAERVTLLPAQTVITIVDDEGQYDCITSHHCKKKIQVMNSRHY